MPSQKSKVLGRYGRPQKKPRGFRFNFRLLRKVFLFCLPLGFLGGIFYFVFLSSYFEIKNINISGLKSVSEDEVRQEVNEILRKKNWLITKSGNYFLFPIDMAKAAIQETFPKISEIKIEKVYPEVLNISLGEREAIGVWCREDSCFYFGNEGVIFEEAPKSFGGIMISVEDQRNFETKIGSRVLEEDDVNFFQKTKEFFAKNFPFAIQSFAITQKGDREIFTTENWRILLDQKESAEYQFSNLKYLLDELSKTKRGELEYVDLRLGNRLYYKYQNAVPSDTMAE